MLSKPKKRLRISLCLFNLRLYLDGNILCFSSCSIILLAFFSELLLFFRCALHFLFVIFVCLKTFFFQKILNLSYIKNVCNRSSNSHISARKVIKKELYPSMNRQWITRRSANQQLNLIACQLISNKNTRRHLETFRSPNHWLGSLAN